ncbi:hypothetical protein V5E97_37635 [Singulisphaera sp. Ch08]|uniref:Transposase n=1 Tax=Singulisphaera sp. Ch08 TaxID=3120278 RepID=A0AAU7CFG0_9BACT
MPDEPELQRHFGQPGNQKKGCGFPVAKWLAMFDPTTGMLLRSIPAPLRSHEMSQVAGDLAGVGTRRPRARGSWVLLLRP